MNKDTGVAPVPVGPAEGVGTKNGWARYVKTVMRVAVRSAPRQFVPAQRHAALEFTGIGLATFTDQGLQVQVGRLCRELPVHLASVGHGLLVAQQQVGAGMALVNVKLRRLDVVARVVKAVVRPGAVGLTQQRPARTIAGLPITAQPDAPGLPAIIALRPVRRLAGGPVEALEGQADVPARQPESLAHADQTRLIGAHRRHDQRARGVRRRA